MEDDSKTRHHHGNLRMALIEAGIEILEDGVMDALSLRKCAMRAGVSHAAPAHHFNGLAGLKAAIAHRAFEIFSDYMLGAAAKGDPSPRGRLKAICRGYLEFSIEHSALMEIIFGVPEDGTVFSNAGRESSNAYLILRDACAPFVPEGTRPEVVEFQVWSLIHGFTLLTLSGRLGPRPTRVEDTSFDAVMTLLDRVGRDPLP